MKRFHSLLADSASTQSERTLSPDLATLILIIDRRDGFLHPPKDCLLRQAQTKLKEELLQV